MTQPDLHIFGPQTKTFQSEQRRGDDFDVGRTVGKPQDVDVPLHMLAESTSLRSFGTKVTWNREPFGGCWQRFSTSHRHARERGRELGSQCVEIVSPPSRLKEKSCEMISSTALDRVEIEMFEHRPFDFIEARIHSGGTPGTFDVTSNRHPRWIEIAGSLGSLVDVGGSHAGDPIFGT